MKPKAFWDEVARLKELHDADEILTYMHLVLARAKDVGLPVTREMLTACGAAIPFFQGVEGWFERINTYAEQRTLKLEHYIVSSGNEEIIRGSRIAHQFRQIFASRYLYDEEGIAQWPAVAINYTTKTQYLFRINKGVDNHWENDKVNRWLPMQERPIPFSRIIYLGDGDTDIPSMKMVRHQGGHSVAVFDPEKWERHENLERVYNLIAEDRANFVVPANYTEGSQLEVTVKGILGRVARDDAGYRE